MAENSGIPWCDSTWNPVTGCTEASEGCAHCWARDMARRFWDGRAFSDVRCHPERLEQPFKWRKPQRIFVVSMGDLFHEDVPDEWIDRIFAVMALTPQHTYQVLTKRPERMRQWFTCEPDPWTNRIGAIQNHVDTHYARTIPPERFGKSGRTIVADNWPLPNVWLGVTAENQQAADERIPILLQIPAAVRWVSVEPMLGAVDLGKWLPKNCPQWVFFPTDEQRAQGVVHCSYPANASGMCRWDYCVYGSKYLNWVVVGCESGPKARPMERDWARSLRNQCVMSLVPFFFKQEMMVDGILVRMPHLDGREWREYPDSPLTDQFGKHGEGE